MANGVKLFKVTSPRAGKDREGKEKTFFDSVGTIVMYDAPKGPKKGELKLPMFPAAFVIFEQDEKAESKDEPAAA